jgi:hypothetical protein
MRLRIRNEVLFLDGMNGMNPNLDLIRLTRVISQEHGIHQFRLNNTSFFKFSHRLNQFMDFMIYLSTCMTSGSHGIFQQ